MIATRHRGTGTPAAVSAPGPEPSTPLVQLSARRAFARLGRIGQVFLGAIWLIDGALRFQPYMFGKTFVTGVILPNAQGQPETLRTPPPDAERSSRWCSLRCRA
jgi:hypothetical protein